MTGLYRGLDVSASEREDLRERALEPLNSGVKGLEPN
jgi:hypothetical protein